MAGECGSTCPVEGGWYSYNPSLAGNAVITAAFAFFVPATLFFGVRYQTPLLAATLTTGIALEVVGFVGRILLHGARDDRIFFLLNQLGTVVGPSVVASALFLTLPHVLTIYGIHLSPVKPLNVAFSFYVFVVITVVLQVVGVVFISGEFRNVTRQEGATVIAASFGVQIVALLWFIGLRIWSILGMTHARPGPDATHRRVYDSQRFKRFLVALDTSAGLLLAFSIYRLLEMTSGLDGSIFQEQVLFMIMNGVLPLACVILLTMFHPGRAFGDLAWSATSLRKANRNSAYPPASVRTSVRTTLAYDAHIRYDPNIRSRSAPHDGDTQALNPYDSLPLPQYAQTPHDIQKQLGNPGLPSHPRAVKDLAERRTSAVSSKANTVAAELSPRSDRSGSTTQMGDRSPWGSVEAKWARRKSDQDRHSKSAKSQMVDSEAIW
ncbi:hypothetical protein NLU13_6291 [Sarocladium strictum]|uniref:Uncharacterized protein n=1 Tax=Sarocladium strictum TaxID=5046 RepID=A0AA39GFL9_SARSR|nr:hypothetical protein NLU13_6291 [Sarocladium strictum]